MAEIIAVDLGGTNIRVARYPRPQPPAAAQTRIPTLPADGPESGLARMIQAIESIAPADRGGMRIGVGSPGPLDPRRGVILDAPNLPGWEDFPLSDRLAAHFGCPAALGNDANLAGLAEWRFGAGRGSDNVLYMTISTGIGGGVICDGRLLIGAKGMAGELGHMTLAMGGRLCTCGKHGHLEGLASGPSMARRARERMAAGEVSALRSIVDAGRELDAQAIGQAARAGNPLAASIVAEAAEAIGCHLASLLHAFNPEVVVLGGGVMHLGDLLMPHIESTIRSEVVHPAYVDGLRLAIAELGDDVGLVGAMVLASDL